MSGHSKWATIKRKKGKEDAKRGQVFTKISKEISIAAREGGGDSASNAKLRMLLEKARMANMPSDNVNRAIKKGTGEIGGANYESSVYEAYAPHGIAIVVETLSDNKNRTASDLRHLFTKFGGSLAESGAVGWMFMHKGMIEAGSGSLSEDTILEALLDYDVDTVDVSDGHASISCALTDLDSVKKACQAIGLTLESAEPAWIPSNFVELENKEHEEKVYKLLEALDELDDVQNVYANIG